ncbi:MAG TPA: class I SAM-dependent methyltransferase [Pyrinomonadaceae bacterium]|nr:class I SAM-dependent methyltransferase [Pyrinomonadaceae bacterium]
MTDCLAFKEELPSWYSPDGGGRADEAHELNTVAHFAKSVEGWLSDSQGLALYQMARSPVAGGVLEIGSFCGKSTSFIALGCKHSGAAFCTVDPHRPLSVGGKEQYGSDFQPFAGDSLRELRGTLERTGLSAYATMLIATSKEARRHLTDLRLKLLFIDGSHDYEDVVSDYRMWHEMVVIGGRLVFHDSNFEGVNQAIQSEVDRDRYAHEGTVGEGGWAMTIWRRVR